MYVCKDRYDLRNAAYTSASTSYQEPALSKGIATAEVPLVVPAVRSSLTASHLATWHR